MHDRTRERPQPSFLERLRRKTMIVVLFCGGLIVVLALARQPQPSQQASETEGEDGLGGPSYRPPPVVGRIANPSHKADEERPKPGPVAPKLAPRTTGLRRSLP